MNSPEADLRGLAVWVAGKHRVKGTKEKAEQLAGDEDDNVKAEAAQAASRF